MSQTMFMVHLIVLKFAKDMHWKFQEPNVPRLWFMTLVKQKPFCVKSS